MGDLRVFQLGNVVWADFRPPRKQSGTRLLMRPYRRRGRAPVRGWGLHGIAPQKAFWRDIKRSAQKVEVLWVHGDGSPKFPFGNGCFGDSEDAGKIELA
jgi:hypothetical protein